MRTREENAYVAIALERAPLGAFEGVPVYLKHGGGARARFTLYCAAHVRFGARRRQRLLARDVKLVYVPAEMHERFVKQGGGRRGKRAIEKVDANKPPMPAKVRVKRRPTIGTVRRAPRFGIECPAELVTMKSDGLEWSQAGAPVEMMAHNISRLGVGLLSAAPVEPGELVRVQLRGQGSLDRVIEGRSKRCRNYQEGWYEIGVELGALDDAMANADLN